MTTDDLDVMYKAYVTCALWSSIDADYAPLDNDFTLLDLDPATADTMRSDCAAFFESNSTDLADMDPEQAGHNFWLTRNGHGAGFWDRGLGELGERLTANSKPFGEYNLYVTDERTIGGE